MHVFTYYIHLQIYMYLLNMARSADDAIFAYGTLYDIPVGYAHKTLISPLARPAPTTPVVLVRTSSQHAWRDNVTPLKPFGISRPPRSNAPFDVVGHEPHLGFCAWAVGPSPFPQL